ncbi:oligosaccharide flippase family protein [Thalassotalea eurytherma]|uniref:Sugar transporter n=1 Tax=Thalassotalea eurytherma TaxID=1144278 RepID=A0ABQ6H1M7_9GAMM|nr:oligosaccharide flippase family protein [Thalassotalea eurytherma]GLX82103.1 sugar transporter [Thalassotalea eurytherma]
MSNIRQSTLYSASSQYIATMIGFAIVVTVARLLTPEEIGVYVITTAIVFFANELKSFGLGGYLVRKEKLTELDVQQVLGLNGLICWSLALLLVAFSFFVEQFYQHENIDNLLRLLSLTFFFTPIIGTAKALMFRNFEFKSLFFVNILPPLLNFIITLALILLGFSYFSMVVAILCAHVLELLLILKLYNGKYSLKPRFSKRTDLLSFGIFVTFTNLCRRMSISVIDLIIGKQGSLSQVSQFSRGTGFLEFTTGILTKGIRPVVTPYLAKEKRQAGNVENAYIKVQEIMASMLVPCLLVCGLASYSLILLVFGEQWLEAVTFIQYLVFWAIFRNFHIFSPSLFITQGFEKLLFLKELTILSITTIAVFFGFQQGLIYVAKLLALIGIVDYLLTSLMLWKILNIALLKLAISLLKIIAISTICALGCYIVSLYLPFESTNPLLVLISLMIVLIPLWLLSLKLFKSPLFDECRLLFKKITAKLGNK